MRKGDRRWVQKVKTVSTFPPPGTFTKPPDEVVRIMADPVVSPRGLGSAIQMVQYFINRAGRHLPPARKAVLEEAKHQLQAMLHEQHEQEKLTKRRDDSP